MPRRFDELLRTRREESSARHHDRRRQFQRYGASCAKCSAIRCRVKVLACRFPTRPRERNRFAASLPLVTVGTPDGVKNSGGVMDLVLHHTVAVLAPRERDARIRSKPKSRISASTITSRRPTSNCRAKREARHGSAHDPHHDRTVEDRARRRRGRRRSRRSRAGRTRPSRPSANPKRRKPNCPEPESSRASAIPGSKYERTRHNIGFRVVDEVARRLRRYRASNPRTVRNKRTCRQKRAMLLVKPLIVYERQRHSAG